MNDTDSLREQAARYRRMLSTVDDPKTKAALVSLKEECEGRLAAAEKSAAAQSAQEKPDTASDQ